MGKVFILMLLAVACVSKPDAIDTNEEKLEATEQIAEVPQDNTVTEALAPLPASGKTIVTGTTSPEQLVAFAKTLIGTPYLYGSTNPAKGFDCSGFITHVFNHFNISVPRSSVDFTDVQQEVPLDSALPGDLILFTGTDSTVPEVGHMGIVVSDEKPLQFIHSTSGKAYGVTITPLNRYYMGRFVKIIRVFNPRSQG